MLHPFHQLRAAATAFTLLFATMAHAASVLIDVGGEPGRSSFATAINNLGQAVGQTDAGDNSSSITGLYLTEQGWTPLKSPDGVNSWFRGINDSGVVVGSLWGPSKPSIVSWTLSNGLVSAPNVLSNSPGFAADINSSGLIVGANTTQMYGDTAYRPMSWSASGEPTTGLAPPLGWFSGYATAVNAQGDVLGTLQDGDRVLHAGIWRQGQLEVLPDPYVGGGMLVSQDINDGGTVVATSFSGGVTPDSKAIQWTNGQAKVLPSLGGLDSGAYAINNMGWVVGFSTPAGEALRRAVMWRDGQVIDLNQYLSADQYAQGWRLISGADVNDQGSIVGDAVNILDPLLAGKQRAFVIHTAIPEPQTFMLFAWGLLGVFWCARRRFSRA